MKIPRDKQRKNKCMLVGMSKKLYKEMVKEMNIIALQEESSQQQLTSKVCNHPFIILYTLNLIIT
jgi:hypothetical protein